ncbi:MAG: membrane protein insertase YidC [Myxococcales bacterium]|nr:membrane protein insertase YidC [Myxococcales bacterium]
MNNTLRNFLLFLAVGAFVYFAFLRKPERPNAGRIAQENPPPTAENRPAARTFRVRTPLTDGAHAGLDARITTRSGALDGLWLEGGQFAQASPPLDPQSGRPASDRRLNLATTYREELLPLRAQLRVRRGEQSVVPDYPDFEGRQVSDREVELTWRGNDFEVTRTFRSDRPFVLQVDTRVRNLGGPVTLEYSLPLYHWATREEESVSIFRRSWQVSEGTCRHGGELYREGRDKLLERRGNEVFPGNAAFVSVSNLYFAMALVPRGNTETSCRLFAEDRPNSDSPTGSIYSGSLAWPRTTLQQGETQSYGATAFFGPKEEHILAAAVDDGRLKDTVNLGFFAFIARQLVRFLRFLHGLTGNWGVAIILLTVCIRMALLPLLARSMKSMAMMQKVKPEIDEINAKFADNNEAKTLATMELYKREGINPLSGCLPQLAQLPIWWALYATLQTSVELYHAPFALWWRDLSAPDPYYVLPLVLGAMMFLQQRVMPPQGMDPAQAKMMTYFFPLFLTAISLFLPAGLALYMLVNSLLGIVQQWYTKQQMDKLKAAGAGTGGGQGIVVRPVSGDSSGSK